MRSAVYSIITLLAVLLPAGSSLSAETEVDGTWQLIYYYEEGKSGDEIVKQNYVIVRRDGVQKITMNGNPFMTAKFVVDSSKKPSQQRFRDQNL